jgi:hypothetical protein
MIKKIIMWIMILTFLNLVISPEFASAGSLQREDKIDTPIEWAGAVLLGVIVIVGTVLIIKKATSSKSSVEKNENTMLASNNPLPKVYKDNLVTPSGELVVLKW